MRLVFVASDCLNQARSSFYVARATSADFGLACGQHEVEHTQLKTSNVHVGVCTIWPVCLSIRHAQQYTYW
jgi:hypothetical protein